MLVSGNRDQVAQQAANSLQVFGSLALPDSVTLDFPETYLGLWDLLRSSDEGIFRYAWGLPRGYAKTTFLKIMVAYLIRFRIRKFPLIVCATEDLAKKFMFDVVQILESDNFCEIFDPITWRHDTAEYKLGYLDADSPFVIKSLGSGTAIRGINVLIYRPDIIIMDDMQTKDNAKSPAEREHLKDWMFSTLLKASDRNNAIYLFVGNMYNKHCLLHILKTSPSWTTFITGSILANGSTLWPEFRSLAQIKETHVADVSVGMEHSFWSEEQNIPEDDIIHGLSLANVAIQQYEDTVRAGGYITVDPAGSKTTSDNVALAVHLVCDGIPYIVDGFAEKLDPSETIERIFSACIAWDINCVGIESVAYQSTLAFWFKKKAKELHLDITVVELYPGRASKHKRIKGFIQSVQADSYRIASQAVHNGLSWEAGFYDFTKTDNQDDFLDVCAMGNQMYTKYPEYWKENWRDTPTGRAPLDDRGFITGCSYNDARTTI